MPFWAEQHAQYTNFCLSPARKETNVLPTEVEGRFNPGLFNHELFNPKPRRVEKSVWLNGPITKVLYMSFDRFLLAVESRDLSQADKSFIRVSSFSILQNFNF